MRRLFAVFVLFALVLPVASLNAQTSPKRPLTFDDLMALKRVGEPNVSPDGKWVLYQATDVNLDANTKTTHLWIVPLDPKGGGESRQLTTGPGESGPKFSPDGKQVLYLSSKEGGQQIWLAPFDSSAGTLGDAHKLTSFATEADGAIWSPDGKNIVFVSSIYPECDKATDPAACNAKKLDEVEHSKVKAQVWTRLVYRHWDHYLNGQRSHIFVVASDGAGAPLDLTPGDYDAPVFSLGGQDYAVSPDGKELAYASNHEIVEMASTNNDLWLVPITGGKAHNITPFNQGSDSSPVYSPDGHYIAYKAQFRPGYESDRFRLILFDRTTGKHISLTETPKTFDRWIGGITWSLDSKKMYFTAENKGENPIYQVAIPTGELMNGDGGYQWPVTSQWPQQLVGGFNDAVSVTPDGATLVFNRMAIAHPNEIYRAPLVYSQCRMAELEPGSYDRAACLMSRGEAITHVNDAIFAGIEMQPQESFWFTGSENAKVQGFVLRPPNFDAKKKYPVKFLIHGGPQGAWGDDWNFRWNPQLFAANGYVVVTINPRGSTGYGQKFIDDINGDWGGRAYEDLMKGLDHAEVKYPFIDKTRECALGASYGGYMINWILGHSDRFRCLVSHDGMFNAESAYGATEELWFNEWEFKGQPWTNRALYQKWSPHNYAANFKTPTLVIHGQRDYRLDVAEGFQLFTTLQRRGVESKMLYFPDEGHWVLKPQNSRLWYQTVNDWVDQHTKPR